MRNNLCALLHYGFAHSSETKNLGHYLVCYLRLCFPFGVQDMFLEKRVFAVHVRAVKQTIPVYNIFKEAFAQVVVVVVLIIFYIVLVRKDILLPGFFDSFVFGFCSFVLSGLCTTLIECSLQFSQFFVQVNKDVCATDLNKAFISSNSEYYVLFVKVRKHSISEDFEDCFPLPCHHTLLVEVDEGYFQCVAYHTSVPALAYCFLHRVPKCLQFIIPSFPQKFFDRVIQQVKVLFLASRCFSRNRLELTLAVSLFSAYHD